MCEECKRGAIAMRRQFSRVRVFIYRGSEHQAGSVDDKFCIVMCRNAMFRQSGDVATNLSHCQKRGWTGGATEEKKDTRQPT